MADKLILQFITLSIYTLFMGFTFCDGFKLRTSRKLLWFAVFLAISAYVLKSSSEFQLSLILPFPTLLAFLLCSYEKIEANKKLK